MPMLYLIREPLRAPDAVSPRVFNAILSKIAFEQIRHKNRASAVQIVHLQNKSVWIKSEVYHIGSS